MKNNKVNLVYRDWSGVSHLVWRNKKECDLYSAHLHFHQQGRISQWWDLEIIKPTEAEVMAEIEKYEPYKVYAFDVKTEGLVQRWGR